MPAGACSYQLGSLMGQDKSAKTADKTEVTVGARNDREIEIASGIKEGDKVLIKPASSAENEYKM